MKWYNLVVLAKDLLLLTQIYMIHYITKYLEYTLGFISIAFVLLFPLQKRINNFFLNETNNQLNETVISPYIIWVVCAIVIGVAFFIFIMLMVSLIKSIPITHRYFKSEIKADDSALLDIIHELYINKQIDFINSEISTKMLLLYLYNLGVIK